MENKPLYYFSGTGGCMAAALRVAAELPEFAPVPIASLAGARTVAVDADAIGLVFPLYYAGLPGIVADFARKLKFSQPCYVFAIVACGFPWSGWAMHQLNALLAKKKQQLSGGFYLQMVDNFLPHYDVPQGEELEKIYAGCDERLGSILLHVKNRDISVEKEKAFHLYAMYPFFIRLLKKYDKYFRTDGRCNSCGICRKVCPVGNIELRDSRPAWKHRCEFCLACISYCPQKTIQWKNVTQQKGRYHYKGITAADIARQHRISQ